MPAGYSGTPLIKKLGIKPGQRVLFLHAPDGYEDTLGALPEGLERPKRFTPPFDFIQYFAHRRRDLEKDFARLRDALAPAGMLWVSWPKKASGVPTDITEDVIREIALPGGLVDVKVCAVDEVWSGLKLVRRVRDRSAMGAKGAKGQCNVESCIVGT